MSKKTIPALCAATTLFLLFNTSAATSPDSTALLLGHTISAEELSEHLQVIASDVLEGRDTGKGGQKMAAAYIRYHFMEMGLLPSVQYRGKRRYYQTFYLKNVTPGEAWIEVSGERLADQYLLYTGRDAADTLTAALVFIGHGSEAVLNEVDVEDKVAVALSEDLYKTRELHKRVGERGGKGLVVLYGMDEDDFSKMRKTHAPWYGRSALKLPDAPPEQDPGMYLVSPAKAAALFDRNIRELKTIATKMDDLNLKPWSRLPERSITSFSSLHEEVVETENVLGLMPGAVRPDELVVVSAHYDHVGTNGTEVFNGADDNGSGTVAMLEIAEAFAEAQRQGHQPYRSVLFAAFTGEERGLLGSRTYTQDPVVSLEQTVADLNLDMLGRTDPKHADNPDYVYVIGSDKISRALHEINEEMNATYTSLTLDYTYNADDDPNRYYYRSDHYNFAKHNIPSIFYFNGPHEDYHKPSDTVDKVNFDLLERRARLVFHTAWHLANMPERIRPDEMAE